MFWVLVSAPPPSRNTAPVRCRFLSSTGPPSRRGRSTAGGPFRCLSPPRRPYHPMKSSISWALLIPHAIPPLTEERIRASSQRREMGRVACMRPLRFLNGAGWHGRTGKVARGGMGGHDMSCPYDTLGRFSFEPVRTPYVVSVFTVTLFQPEPRAPGSVPHGP